MKPLRLGIAGLGAAARQILSQVKSVPEVCLTAGADIRPQALAEFEKKYGCKGYSSVQAMCEGGEIDAIWIATPNIYHAEHTIIAAECGIHVIVEKPMAVTLAEAEKMIAAADRNGVRLVQGHSKIYSPAIQKIREVIQSGRLGRVIQINSWNSNDWLQRLRLPDEVDTTLGGGVCFRQGPHQVDIVRYIGGGLVKSVRALTGRADKNFVTEGHYTSFMAFEDGTAATLAFNGYGHFDIAELTWGIGEGGKRLRESDMTAPQARVTGPVDQESKYANPRNSGEGEDRASQSFFGLTLVACERGAIRQSPEGLYVYSETGREIVPVEADSGRAAELRELSRALEQNRPAFPDGRWGMASLEVCLAMLESSQKGCEISMQHQGAAADMHLQK